MKNIILLSSDTAHHRYFINSILSRNLKLQHCFFETEHIKPPFKVGPLFEQEESAFELENFFKTVPTDLPEGLCTYVDTVNTSETIEKISAMRPDFGVVFGTGKIVPEVIHLFPEGMINVHRGIAQRYRGLDSDLWAVYHKDYDKIGVTIHKVDPALDTGGICYQKSMPLKPGMKIHQIRYYTTLIATELVIKTLKDYLGDALKYIPQKCKGRYYSFMPLDLKRIVGNKFNTYCERIQ